jgi:hypothetical protein
LDKSVEYLRFAAEDYDRVQLEQNVWSGLSRAAYLAVLIDRNDVDVATEYVHQLISTHDIQSPDQISIARQSDALLAEYLGDFSRAESLRLADRDATLKARGLTDYLSMQAMFTYAVCLNLQNKNAAADSVYRPLLFVAKDSLVEQVKTKQRRFNHVNAAIAWVFSYYGGSKASDLELARRVSSELMEVSRDTPNEVQAFLINGVANVRLENYSQAKSSLMKAMTLRWPHQRALRREAERVLAKLLTRRNELTELEQFYVRQIAACNDGLGKTHPETLGLQVRFAGFLVKNNRNTEHAEQLLLNAHESATGTDFMSRLVRTESRDELAKLYKSSGRTELAKEWLNKDAKDEVVPVEKDNTLNENPD